MWRLSYLHGEPFSINGVLWSWPPHSPPVKVKLGSSVRTRQASSRKTNQLRKDKVGCTQKREVASQRTVDILIITTRWTAGGGRGFVTGVTSVLHCHVDSAAVTDEGEGLQGAAQVDFPGDDVDGWLAESSTAGKLSCPVDGVWKTSSSGHIRALGCKISWPELSLAAFLLCLNAVLPLHVSSQEYWLW